MVTWPNQAAAGNSAIASRFPFARARRAVPEQRRSAASDVMRLFTLILALSLLLASGTRCFALGYDLSQVEHDWAIDGPGGRYGLIQFAPYGPLVGRRTLVMFASHSQEIPVTAPCAAALLGAFTLCVGFGVLFWRRNKT